MTEQFSNQQCYRLAKARRALASAKLLFDDHDEQAAAGRLYFACFHAVSALLLQLGLTPKTHAGVRSLFGLHVIHEGLLPTELGDLFIELSEARHKADYIDSLEIESAQVADWLPAVTHFIDAIEQLIPAGRE